MKRIMILLCLALVPCSFARAALTINIVETGSGAVFAAAVGSLNVDGIPFRNQQTTSASFVRGTGFLSTFDGIIVLGTGDFDVYNISSSVVFSAGANFLANSSSGSSVGVDVRSTTTEGLYVPRGYVSGTPINSSATWNNQTITSMGLIPGTHVISWGSGPTADTLTIIIDGTPPPPSSFPVEAFVSGLTGTGLQLQNNGGDTLSILANGASNFATQLADGAGYNVTVSSQPSGQACTVTAGGSGTIAGDTAHVDIDCAADGGPPAPPATTGPAAAAAAQPVPALPLWALLMVCTGLGLTARSYQKRSKRT